MSDTNYDAGIEYCNIYFGANLTIKDLDEGETEEAASSAVKALELYQQ